MRFGSRILLPVVVATAIATLLAAVGLFQATARSDAIAVERQLRETKQAISSSMDEMALNQQSVAIWDDPLLMLRRPEPDWQWMDDNIGVWLHDLFWHDRVYVLDGSDAPIYAVVDGARVEPFRYGQVAAALKPLVEAVRGRLPVTNNDHERLPGQPLPATSTARTGEEAVHATRIIALAGRPAAASVMRMLPLTEAVKQEPGTEPLLISVRFLDGRFLEELTKRHLIDDPRYSPSDELERGEHGFPLISDGGERLGFFIWRPELPGTAVLKAVAPTAMIASGIMVLIMALLAYWLYRSMREQQSTILELQTSEAQAHHLAFHDTLTGLPNRAMFNDRLEKGLARARQGKPVAVLLLDLDRFKNVNDTLGHMAGDALIRDFASRILHLLDESDTVARLGGDEFAILRCKEATPEGIAQLCERILGAVREPFELLGNAAFVGVSIGVTIAPEAGTDRVDIMRKSDIALYRAKASGRDRFCLFTPAMDDSIKLRNTIEEELRAALVTGEGLRVHYQPQVTGPEGRIVGLEALVRWQHPTLGMLAPDKFIAVAEGTGLIGRLGDWVLRQACSGSKRWPDLFIAVNLSPTQFRAADFADRIIETVRECGADPHRIELEVTESVLLDDSDTIIQALAKLRAAGFRIALDDFGTGYSSLSYLRRFEVDKIKIDRSFVQHLGHAVDSAAIISAVLTLGHAMGLTVTAEGVETAEQHEFLEAAGCNVMQGFLFSRPLPAEDIDRLLESSEAARGAA